MRWRKSSGSFKPDESDCDRSLNLMASQSLADMEISSPAHGQISPRESAVFRLMCLCARRSMDNATADELRSVAGEGGDWFSVLEAGYWHSLIPLLHRHLGAVLGDNLPSSIAEVLRKEHDENARRAERLADELSRVLRELRAAGIIVLPFKGPSLALSAYGDLGARSFINLDLLISREDMMKASERLSTLGYRQVPGSHLMPVDAYLHLESKLSFQNAESGIALELYHQITPRRYFSRVQTTRFFARSRTLPMGARSWPILSPEDCVVALCLHAIKGGFWPSLRHVCDVAEVIKSAKLMNWSIVMKEAAALHCERAVHLGVLLAHKLLGAELPAEVLEEIRRDAMVVSLVGKVQARLAAQQRGFPSLVEATRYHLALKKGVRRKALYLLCIFTTPSERDFQFHGLKVSLRQAYPIRIVKLAAKCVRQLANCVFKDSAAIL
jgi:hypothetical protein